MQNCEFIWRGHIRYESPVCGSLKGLRLAVKDVFDIAGIPTSAGNPDWLRTHPVPKETALVVRAFLNAGAKVVGKTLTDELAYSLNGVNIHYGTPVNPRGPERLPGGSSSGSAVAVASGNADIGLGSDTGGSIRVPGSYCGLYALRTTYGIISREGMMPLAPLFDTVGWMTADLGNMIRVTEAMLPAASTRLTKLLVVKPEIGGRKLWQPEHQDWLARVAKSFDRVEALDVPSEFFAEASQDFQVLQGRAIWEVHRQWIETTEPVLADDIRERLQWCASLSDEEAEVSEARRAQLNDKIMGRWLPSPEWCVALPTTPGPAPMLNSGTDWMAHYRTELMGLTAPAGLAGIPQLHLPVIERDGAPMGVSLLASRRLELALVHRARDLVFD